MDCMSGCWGKPEADMTDSSDRKKIVFITSRALYEPALHNRITPFMKLLVSQGHEVLLVCPRHADNRARLPAGVQLVQVAMVARRPRDFIKRAIHEADNALLLLRHASKIKADVWLVTIPSMFLAFIAPAILRRRTTILDIRDLSWEYLADDHFLQKVSKRAFRLVFRRCLNFFCAVMAANPAQLSYVQRYWRGSSPPLLVSNGIELSRFQALAGLECPSEGVHVTYIGNIGLAQRLETLIEAARLLPEVRFTIIGAGLDYERIVQLIAQYQLKNVRLTGRVSWESVRGFYNQTDILYAQLAPDYSGAVPSKLYEYLATGKYIIYGGQGEAAALLKGFEHHRLIPPCDVDALVAAIKEYDGGACKRKLCLANRERVGSRHIREKSAEQLVQTISRTSLGG